MALAFITAKKFIQSQNTMSDVFYLGNTQTDGFTYFNDETSYRCITRNGQTYTELFYIPKQIWMQCNIFNDVNIIDFNPFSILSGAGSAAPAESVEAAVQWMINKASNTYITYSQSNRNLKNPNGTSYDCSSFVITGFYAVGVNINATYTGDMVAGFTAAGWEFIAGSRWEANQLQRGDILINTAYHTQVYIGDNKDVNCGSTPARIVNHSVDYWGRGWTGILRYKGTTTSSPGTGVIP